jgi:3-oxoadipate enol-lactonase
MEVNVPVPGGEIWAEDSGGGGTSLVLVHPDWGNADIWSPLIGVLPGRFRVIRYDNRGYGRSLAPVVPFS